MKKILLLSDTHGYLDERICAYAAEADEVWHAGDIGKIEVYDQLNSIRKTRAVHGNIDNDLTRTVCPEHLQFNCEGLSVLMLHIGGYPGHYSQTARTLLQICRPQLFISGHSHILRVMRDPKLNLLHMNPGAAGIHGFHSVRTMIRFKIAEGKVKDPEVIELGPRGSSTEPVG